MVWNKDRPHICVLCPTSVKCLEGITRHELAGRSVSVGWALRVQKSQDFFSLLPEDQLPFPNATMVMDEPCDAVSKLQSNAFVLEVALVVMFLHSSSVVTKTR